MLPLRNVRVERALLKNTLTPTPIRPFKESSSLAVCGLDLCCYCLTRILGLSDASCRCFCIQVRFPRPMMATNGDSSCCQASADRTSGRSKRLAFVCFYLPFCVRAVFLFLNICSMIEPSSYLHTQDYGKRSRREKRKQRSLPIVNPKSVLKT